MNFEPRSLDSTALVITDRQAVHYEDSGNTVISGIVTLLSGAKYNVNGTWVANSVQGKMRAIYLCRGDNMQTANNLAEELYDLAGRTGTLSAVEYTSGGVATHTCSAFVEAARPITMFGQVGASIGRAHYIRVEMIFDRLTGWS